MQQSEDYVKRQKLTEIRRLGTAAKWCGLVSGYYVSRVCLIILPKWENHKISTQLTEVLLLLMFVFCCVIFFISWRNNDHLGLIKYVLFIQIVQM